MSDLQKRFLKHWAITTGILWALAMLALINDQGSLMPFIMAIAAPFVAMPIAHFSDW